MMVSNGAKFSYEDVPRSIWKRLERERYRYRVDWIIKRLTIKFNLFVCFDVDCPNQEQLIVYTVEEQKEWKQQKRLCTSGQNILHILGKHNWQRLHKNPSPRAWSSSQVFKDFQNTSRWESYNFCRNFVLEGKHHNRGGMLPGTQRTPALSNLTGLAGVMEDSNPLK